MRRVGWSLALILGWGGLGVGAARADEPVDPLSRLEELLRKQSEELERLRQEVEALKTARSAPEASAPPAGGTAPAPATWPPAPEPVKAAAPPAPSGPPPLPPIPPVQVPVEQPALGRPSHLIGEASAPRGVSWGGYLQLEYIAPSNKNSYIDLHRLIFSANAWITEGIDLRAEVEIEHGGVSDELEGEIVLEYADVRFHVCDAFVPKVGALLIPFGRYNLYHDDPYNDFTLRPFVGRYLVPTGFGQPGIGAEGFVPFGCGHIFSYDVALTSGYKDAFTPDSGVRDCRQPWNQDNNESKQVWGRVAAAFETRFLDTLEVGASGTYGRYDDEDDNDISGFGVDLLLRKGPFEFKGEYVAYDLERDDLDPPDAVKGLGGLLLEGAFHFMPPGLRCCRNVFVTDTSHFTLAARYQTMDLHDEIHGAAFQDDLEAWSVGLNYRITENTVFRIDHTWYDPVNGEDVQEFTASFSTWF